VSQQLGSWAEEKTKRRSKGDKQNKEGDGTVTTEEPIETQRNPAAAGEHQEEEESGEAQVSTLPLHS
jgi:hypothetical protein